MNNARLETNIFIVPPEELESNLYFFYLELISDNDAPGLAMQAADTVTLWHRRMRHLNSDNLNLLKIVESNGVDFGEAVPDLDICAVGKSHQLTSPPEDSQQHSETHLPTSHDRFDGTDYAGGARRLQARLQNL
ncbi:unnamed protein product [Sphacelaria rigidula]